VQVIQVNTNPNLVQERKSKLNDSHLAKLEKELELSIYQDSYYEFYKMAFAQLHPGQHYDENWHAKYLCDLLQEECERVIRKEPRKKDIIINVPFRSSKSLITTIIWPVWCWTKDPSLKFITTSFSGNLAIEHSSKSRDLIFSPWFQRLYGKKVVMKPDTQAKGHYETMATGMRKAVGIGGQITGSGADFIINDDPQDPNMASSDVERRNVIDSYSNTVYSRLNDPDVGVRIIVQQRLNEMDLTGYLMHPKVGRPEDHKHICIPATYSEKVVSPPELKEYYQNGLFWPSRFHREALAQWKKTLGGLQYAGQLEQLPAPLEGNLVKRGWFEIKKANEVSRNADREPIIFFLDTAYTEKQENDPSAVVAAFKRDTKVYLINAAEVRMIFPDLVPFVQEFVKINGYSRHGSMIWVEPKASGKSLVQSLRAVSDLNIGEIVSDLVNGKDKTGRLASISPYIQSGKVVLLEGQWNDHFLTQVCSFPNASHDEFVDLLSYLVDELLVRGDGTLGG